MLDMVRFVVTIKLGNNGASMIWRNVESGAVGSATFFGPVGDVQLMIKRAIEANPDFEVKYE